MHGLQRPENDWTLKAGGMQATVDQLAAQPRRGLIKAVAHRSRLRSRGNQLLNCLSSASASVPPTHPSSATSVPLIMDDPEYEMFQSARTRQQSPGSPSSPMVSSRRRNSHSESRTRHHDQVDNPDTRSQESVGRAAFTEDASHLQPAANRTRDRPMSSNSSFDERNTIVPKPLTAVDLASLVFNKMVGTGIFTVPGHVLAATSSKKVSIGLWVAGGLYTALW